MDPDKLGVAGNSGGGTQAAYLAALEPRLAVDVPSCYVSSWQAVWSGPGSQDSEQVFAKFLKDGPRYPDFLIAFAPKPIQVKVATRDFFPIAGARVTYAQARRVSLRWPMQRITSASLNKLSWRLMCAGGARSHRKALNTGADSSAEMTSGMPDPHNSFSVKSGTNSESARVEP